MGEIGQNKSQWEIMILAGTALGRATGGRRSAQRGGCSATSSWPPLQLGSGASPARSAAHWARKCSKNVTMEKPILVHEGRYKDCSDSMLQQRLCLFVLMMRPALRSSSCA